GPPPDLSQRQITERQQRREQAQAQALQQVTQARAALAAAEAEAARLARQARALPQRLAEAPAATPAPPPRSPLAITPPPIANNLPEVLALLTPVPLGPPCATAVGQSCSFSVGAVGGSGVSGTATGVVIGSQNWTVDLTGLAPNVAAAVVF